MSFAWDEYRNLSQWLLSQQSGKASGQVEALLRSAVSRSYYSAHHLSRSLLVLERDTIPSKDVHAFVRDKFKHSSDIYRQKLGEDLKRLLEYRRSADYDDDFKYGQLGLVAVAANHFCDNIFRHLIATSLA